MSGTMDQMMSFVWMEEKNERRRGEMKEDEGLRRLEDSHGKQTEMAKMMIEVSETA